MLSILNDFLWDFQIALKWFYSSFEGPHLKFKKKSFKRILNKGLSGPPYPRKVHKDFPLNVSTMTIWPVYCTYSLKGQHNMWVFSSEVLKYEVSFPNFSKLYFQIKKKKFPESFVIDFSNFEKFAFRIFRSFTFEFFED